MADKTQLFRSLRHSYQILGIYSPETNQCHLFDWKIIFTASSMLLLFITSFAFFAFEAETLDDYGTSFYASLTQITSLHNFVLTVWRMPVIIKLMRNFEDFIESRAYNPDSRSMYHKLTEKIERLFRFMDIFIVKICFVGVVAPPLIRTSVNYFVYDMRDESFYMPLPTMLPFNWKTPLGYSIAYTYQFIGYFCTVFPQAAYLGLFIASCWIFISFAKDIAKNDLPQLNANKVERDGNFGEWKTRFCKTVRFMDEFNVIYEFLLFAGFLYTMLSICSSLLAFFAILKSSHKSNLTELISPLNFAAWSFAPIFMYTELGTAVTNEFARMNDKLYQCNAWYSLPIEMQRMMMIFLAETQDPILIRGFCNIVCIRDSFKKTVHVGFSYFITLLRING